MSNPSYNLAAPCYWRLGSGRYAAILCGETRGTQHDDLLTDAGVWRIASSDRYVAAIVRDLESRIEYDWIASGAGPAFSTAADTQDEKADRRDSVTG